MSDKAINDAVKKLLEQRTRALEMAIQEMCVHYNCAPEKLSLHKTSNSNVELLVKSDPGLAYRIEVKYEDTGAYVVGEPVFIDSEGKLNDY